MTPAEIHAAREKLQRLEWAQKGVAEAQVLLNDVNEYVKRGQVWKPTLTVKQAASYSYGRDVVITIPITGEYIQQAAINQLISARRNLVEAESAL